MKQSIEYAHIAYSLTAAEEGVYPTIPTEAEMASYIEEKGLLKDQ